MREGRDRERERGREKERDRERILALFMTEMTSLKTALHVITKDIDTGCNMCERACVRACE